MRKCGVLLVLFLLLAVCSTAALATNWFVATTGNDYTGDGSISSPYASLNNTLKNHAQPGDTICVRAGTYPYEAINYGATSLIGGSPGSPITIAPYDGDFTAQFSQGGFWLHDCKYLTLTGLELSASNPDTVNDHHPLQIDSELSNWFTPEYRSNHILVTNCKIHDAAVHGGCIKIGGADYLTFENCEFSNLGSAYVIGGAWEQYNTIKKCYFHDWFGAVACIKGGSLYNTYDSNVINQRNIPESGLGLYCWGFLMGDGTGITFCNPDFTNVPYEAMYTVIRNNILDGSRRCAVALRVVGYTYIYNNLFRNAADFELIPDTGYITVLYIPGESQYCNSSDHIYIVNNIFHDNTGSMRPYQAYASGYGNFSDWNSNNNNFYNNGQTLAQGYSPTPDPTAESGSTYGDPHLTLSGSPTTWQGWVNYYRPQWDSQSNAMLKDHGASSAGNAPYPSVIKDIEGNTRPRDNGWDIGPYEYQGTTVAPVANFSALAHGYMQSQLWGTSPATFDFTDGSSGGPTSWSWSFGDSTTSTAQNPSHTYSNYGQYTVALTATNSAGNDTETKTDYLTVKALDAEFSGSPTWGATPLAVSFTDHSTNSPTSWSWTFGDGGTSTAQNPSHTYSSAAYYDVGLTATDASGNDTETKTSYVTACTEVVVYPDEYNVASPASLVSGSLSDLTADDSSYMVFSRSSGGYDFHVNFRKDTSYTRSQVRGIKYEAKLKSSVGGSAIHVFFAPDNMAANEASAWEWDNSDAPVDIGTTDQWLTATRTNMDQFMGSDGKVGVGLCGCRPNGDALNLSYNVVRWRICLKPSQGQPPVANFSGTPTSGNAPLNVSFTDFSTNTPTSWSWSFGDSSTSTAQSPSHSYSSAGTYTVSLTATNAGGSDQETKTNYIAATGAAPVASFTASTETAGQASLQVSFTDTSTNTPTSWSWSFGDSTTSTAQNPSHTYTSAGTYAVALTATNAGGNNTATYPGYVAVRSATGSVTLNPTQYILYGGTSIVSGALSDANTENGTYLVTRCNSSQGYMIWYFFPTGYTASQLTKLRVEMRVNNTSTVTPRWTFYIATLNAAASMYTGTWTTSDQWVTFETTDVSNYLRTDYGTGTVAIFPCACKQNNDNFDLSYDVIRLNLTLSVQAPVADFSGTPTSGTAPLNVSFTDSSTNTPTSWSWSFGDSSTSTAQNPSHTYSSAGTYTVSLTATNAGGSDQETKTNYLTVTTPNPPVASFSASTATAGTASYQVSFTDTSTNTPTSWSWSFGDSSTSTAQNPSHTYTSAGTYTVALTATNAGGNDTATYPGYVTARSANGTVFNAPTYYTLYGGTSIVSGALSDTNTENGTYLVTRCNTSNQAYMVWYFWPTGYTASQLSKLRVEMKVKNSSTVTPRWTFYIATLNAAASMASGTWTTSDQWVTFETTDVANYLRTDYGTGTVAIFPCACAQNTTNYDLSYDVIRLICYEQ